MIKMIEHVAEVILIGLCGLALIGVISLVSGTKGAPVFPHGARAGTVVQTDVGPATWTGRTWSLCPPDWTADQCEGH